MMDYRAFRPAQHGTAQSRKIVEGSKIDSNLIYKALPKDRDTK
jgi:hypothetical protein